MPDQLSLFSYDREGRPVAKPFSPAPAQAHSPTSIAAAKLMDGKRSTLLAKLYYALLGMLPDGLTDEEGQALLGMDGNTYRPRRVELQEAGLVADGKLTRKTKSKREAVVWVAVPIESL
jgi:hypothetical protein